MTYQWYPGHMTKTLREMQEDIRLVDLIIELADARIPKSSRNPEADRLSEGRARILLLGKSDLADEEENRRWLAFYQKAGLIAFPADSRNNRTVKALMPRVKEACAEKIERNRKRGIIGRPLRAMVLGIPNVGKSTLISVVSEAKPEIADYHFTTLTPVLGVVRISGDRSFVMADIPGLIEGANQGAGLGHEFLRHVERCRLLVHIVDVSGSEGRDPKEDFRVINSELGKFNPDLLNRPMLVAGNKCDLATDGQIADFRAFVEEQGYEFFPMSAAIRYEVDPLLNRISELLSKLPPVRHFEPEPEPAAAPAEEGNQVKIRRENGVYHVEGAWLEKTMSSINFADEDGMRYFDSVLLKTGVIDALRSAGVQEGDTVDIYGLEFDFTE